MELYDQHVHSRHSFDSKSEPAACVVRGVEQGLAGVTFTEHFDTHPDDWPGCVYDDERYAETIRGLREEFGDRIFVGKGIEVCYQPERMPFILDFLRRHEFDLVVLSVHYFGGEAVYQRRNWEGIDSIEGTRRYLETLREAVRFCEALHRSEGRVFDVLGHLDVVKRYTQRFYGRHDVARFSRLIDDTLAACVAADVTPEINTSSLRQGVDETMPGADVVARYAELGGEAMSVGSDAHLVESVGADLEIAVEMLLAAGIRELAVFRGRERRLSLVG
ncbi:MAG: histidinol-phosphatase HisJ family protein [Phycisphaerae bacterium]|jgi:histidinol-phosphatase (PHP family)